MPEEHDHRTCCVEGCAASIYAKSMCERHYARVRRNGSAYIDKRSERRDSIGWLLSNYVPITESGCWIWEGHSTNDGYGRMKVGREHVLTHRLSYEAHYGEIPSGYCVLHKCDTPSCINPSPLFLGTRTDNNTAKIEKNRHDYGEASPWAKLSDDAVLDAKNSHEPITVLARRNGVSHETMRKAVNGTTWRHVNG